MVLRGSGHSSIGRHDRQLDGLVRPASGRVRVARCRVERTDATSTPRRRPPAYDEDHGPRPQTSRRQQARRSSTNLAPYSGSPPPGTVAHPPTEHRPSTSAICNDDGPPDNPEPTRPAHQRAHGDTWVQGPRRRVSLASTKHQTGHQHPTGRQTVCQPLATQSHGDLSLDDISLFDRSS